MTNSDSTTKIEYEAKFLDIDHALVRKHLAKLGADCLKERRLMRRINFDFPDMRLKSEGAWVRLRDQGDGTITLAIKTEKAASVDGVEEQEVRVDDFEVARAMLTRLGLRAKSYQESYRESWALGDVEVELDEWPWIPPTLEIEARDEQTVRQTAEALNLPWERATFGSITTTYRHYYDATDDEINHHPEFRFDGSAPWPTRE